MYSLHSTAQYVDSLVKGCGIVIADITCIVSYKICGSGGIRTHASEETGALNQRLRPLGHATKLQMAC